MAKRTLSALLLLMAVVGCSDTDSGVSYSSRSSYDSNTINFVTQTTKATCNDIDSMKCDNSGFIVYGLELDSSSWYDNIDGSSYIYDSSSQSWGWASSDTPSWPVPFSPMSFYAYYPSSAVGFALSSAAPSTIVGDIEVQASILDQIDYLAASSGEVTTKPMTGVLPLNFEHIMSKISFSVLQYEGVLTVIRQLGIENIINEASYDYINSEWYNLSNTNLGSFDDYVGSSGPFAKYGVADQVDPIRIDSHYLMLIPQTGGDEGNQIPLWDGTLTRSDSGEGVPSGAYVSIRYRTSANEDTEDMIGYAFRQSSPNDTELSSEEHFYNVYKKDGGTYNGPLYIKAGFRLSAGHLNWEAGSEYNYTLQLSETGGIYLSEYYYDVDGRNTMIRVSGAPEIGDTVITTDVSFGITVDGWNYSESNIYPL